MKKALSLTQRLRNSVVLPMLAGFMTYNVAKADPDEIFSDDFEPKVFQSQNWQGDYEGSKVPIFELCAPNDNVTIELANITYATGDSATLSDPDSNFRGVGPISLQLEPILNGSGGSSNGPNGCPLYEVLIPMELHYFNQLDNGGMVYFAIDWIDSNGGTGNTSVLEKKLYADEETAQDRIQEVLNSDPTNIFAAYDTTVNINGSPVGPFDAEGFSNYFPESFALEYNGENRTPQEMLDLENSYTDNGNSTSRVFYEIGKGSLEDITEQLNQIFQ